ncbi:adenylate/guanylate cyclase domain-containing protein [candidate division CSSED10-310 bacterium]|uniref:Adenylate/guanylate cyclase domain-containing protein n=1 Tax=candidate division CSSED10-310 bacterium TaxID=2855610 RepID=A0ABV6Z4M5_UNCC1
MKGEKKSTGLGIRFRLIMAMILLIVVSLVITSYFMATVNKEAIEDQTKAYQIFLSERFSDITKDMIDEACAELYGIEMILNDQRLTTDQTIRLAGYQIATSLSLEFVNIYDVQGTYVDSLVQTGETKPAFSPETLTAASREKARLQDCSPEPVTVYESRPYLPFIISWKAEDQIQGYLWTAIDIRPLSTKLDETLRIQFEDKLKAYLVNENFEIVVHPAWESIVTQRSRKEDPLFIKNIIPAYSPKNPVGISSDYSDEQGQWLVNTMVIPRINWLLIVQQQRKIAYRTLFIMQQKIALFGVLFVIGAAVIGALLGRGLTRPILAVAQGARELAAQKFSHRIKVNSRDEIGEMAETFNYLGQSLEEYDARIKQEIAIRSDLSRYLTPELVDAIIERKANLNLGGRRQNVAVLFADVVSFTPLSESHSPETVVALLNELFTILTQIIFRNKGMIDKFIGDCVMALFGVTEEDENSPAQAVKAAEEMIRWLDVGNKKWKRQYNVELQIAVAIHYGEVIIGNVGSEKRMEFTAIGDVVNTAARMEKIAKPNQILITETIRDHLSEHFSIKSHGRFALRGKSQDIDVFEVIP